MKILTDLEVGELWQKYQPCDLHHHQDERAKDIIRLIEKLVEDRQERIAEQLYMMPMKLYSRYDDGAVTLLKNALEQFGIEFSQWSK